jgi:hypothetical protein
LLNVLLQIANNKKKKAHNIHFCSLTNRINIENKMINILLNWMNVQNLKKKIQQAFALTLLTDCAFPPWLTDADTSKALAMSRAVRNLAVMFRDVTLRAFPSFLTVA